MKAPFYALVFTLTSVTIGQSSAQESLIVGHFGANDPTDEGFSLLSVGSPSLAPVADDLGLDAWSIAVGSGEIGQYSWTLNPQETALLSGGWVLSLTLRVVEPVDIATVGVFAQLRTTTPSVPLLAFGSQSDGDPIVSIDRVNYVLEGAGPGYHTYQVRFDAESGTGSVWADGSLLAADIPGQANPSVALLEWGGGQHPPGDAVANWHEVSLWAVPEPSSIALMILGGALFVWRFRHPGFCHSAIDDPVALRRCVYRRGVG